MITKNILKQLTDLLKKDERLISQDGILLKNKVQELARKNDPALIKRLLSNKVTKQYYFFEVEKTLIFDKEKFINFISNKQFLPDSYTTFKNKIGLTCGDRYLSENKQVVLIWPYKDCILEGGMTKEDQKRDEIFYNETLAPDDINRLLDAKVFTNFKRIDKNGEHKLDEFKRNERSIIKDNLIIKGNNLLVLASLKKEFSGKVKLIYIDPPYNTGSDGFNYNDSFNHSTWLTFMKNRLEIARSLLAENGAIFVQCDDNEQAYLKILMDEVFGRACFRECIAVKTSTPSGVNAVNVKRGERLFKLKEYLLFYSKQSQYRFNPILIKADYNRNYRYEITKNEKGYNIFDLTEKYKENQLIAYCLNNPENIFSLEKNNKKAGEKVKKALELSKKSNKVVEYKNSKDEIVLLFKGGVLTPLINRVLKENEGNSFGTLISDFWDDEIFQTSSSEGGVALPGGKKPEKLLKRIIEISTNPGDLIIDYHLGSGTTCAVAHKMGRQYIGIEQLDYGKNDSVVRLKNVIKNDQTGISKVVNWNGGGNFVYMELAKWNEDWIEKIKKVKEKKELMGLWDEMKEAAFLSYKVDPTTIDAEAKDFADLSIGNQKKFLIECLDKNHLYINLSEMEDREYNLNKQDIENNKSFYNKK